MSKLRKILFIPDTHRPYHDKKAWALLLKVGKAFKPDILNIQGDFADFYSVSSHDKDPNRARNLEWEVDDVKAGLDDLDNMGAKEKYYVSGNHEDRLERYLKTKAPELFNVVTIPKLLELKERGWLYTPYKSHRKIGKLYSTHDVGSAGKGAIFKLVDTYQHNAIAGHTHRIAYIVEGNASGEAHVAASFGWLGDRDQIDYMHQIQAKRAWALGFGIGYLAPDDTIYLTPVPIINYSCVVEGVCHSV